MKSVRVIAPVFLAALQVIAAFVLLLVVMFVYGGLATVVALWWLAYMFSEWALTYWAYQSGVKDGVRREH